MRDLLIVGNTIASELDGVCYDYEVDHRDKTVTFFNRTDGKEYCSLVSFKVLERDYGVRVD